MAQRSASAPSRSSAARARPPTRCSTRGRPELWNTGAMGHRVVDVEQIEPAGPGGAVRFVRRELGTRAFGINQCALEPGSAGPEHHEQTTGQEEVYIVIGGGRTMRI